MLPCGTAHTHNANRRGWRCGVWCLAWGVLTLWHDNHRVAGRREREQYQGSFHDASFGSVPLCMERLDGVGREFRMAVWWGELTCHPVC